MSKMDKHTETTGSTFLDTDVFYHFAKFDRKKMQPPHALLHLYVTPYFTFSLVYKRLVKLMQRMKIAHSFLQYVSNLFHFIYHFKLFETHFQDQTNMAF